jgi:hypothetical protein
MLNALLRWSIPLTALFILGPIAAHFTSALRAADGGGQTSLFLNTSPLSGILAGLLALALALGIGIIGARFIEGRSGLLAAGFVLAWAAWGGGRVDRILARTQTSSTLYTLAIEAAVLALAAVAVAFIILRIPTRVPRFIAAGDTTRDRTTHIHREPTAFVDKALPIAILAAAAGAALGGWLIAQDFLKGQTFAAAAVGGVLAAAAGRLVSQRITPAAFFLGLMLVAIAGPIIATFLHPSALGPARAALAGTLFPLARPLPLDWLAGAFVGIPLGLWWAGSLLEKYETR